MLEVIFEMTEDEMVRRYFDGNLADEISEHSFDGLNEIRLRAGQPVVLRYADYERALKCTVDKKTLEAAVAKMSEYSAYAFREEVKKGYLTLKGGFRVGICGRAVISKCEVKGIKDISSLNIRVPRRAVGYGERVMEVYDGKFKNTVIVSPPGCGKTTLLRDLIRRLVREGYNVGVCDERGEIGCFGDLGLRADILEGFSKKDAIEILIRGLNPDIVAMDELGGREDFLAVKEALYKGAGILATMHGEDVSDEMRKVFRFAVVLEGNKGKGEIKRIYDCLD